MKRFTVFLLSMLGVLILGSGALALDFIKRYDLVLPRTVWADVSLSGMDRSMARQIVHSKLEEFYAVPFKIAARGKVQDVTLKELGVIMNESTVFAHIPFAHKFSIPEIILKSIGGTRILPDIDIEEPQLLRVIEEKFPEIPRSANAHIELVKGKYVIKEAVTGVTPYIAPLALKIETAAVFLEHAPLTVEFMEASPTVFAADLEAKKDEIIKNLPAAVTVASGDKKWVIDFASEPERIVFEKDARFSSGFLMRWDSIDFSRFMKDKVLGVLESAPEDARIWKDSEGEVQFEGHAVDGRAVEQELLLGMVNDAIGAASLREDQAYQIEIPLKVVAPKIEISSDLQELGIREIISTGHSAFAGSPANRMHNIGVGISKYNGLIIKRGDTFSFNDNLGPVDASTGYKKELVIKPEGTIPEFGGGLCQVSTTIYRAALYAGLPMVERSPHSYAVTYYSQVGGHGIDATIYPPARDLKFKNDTPGAILIQSYVDGVNAYFKFYGTSDGREVKMEGPYISNKRGVPAEPLLVPDPTLAAGVRKQVEKPHGGFDALWYRYITKDGNTVKEEIFSRYRAVPAKYLVGGPAPAASSADIAPANPFE